MNPFDGVYAYLREVAIDKQIELVVELRANGKVTEAETIAKYTLSVEGRGRAERLLCLIQALCRFLNAGGDPASDMELLAEPPGFLTNFKVEIPPDWVLMNCLQDVPEPTIIYCNPYKQLALVVKEGESSEYQTMEELNAGTGH